MQLGGVTSGGQFGKLSVTGSAALAGAIEAELESGYSPTAGDSFKVISDSGTSGSFTTVNLPETSAAYFQASVSSTAAVLSAVATATNLTPVSIDTISPGSGTVGQNLSVKFTVRNQGTQPTPVSSWVDSVYLSQSSTLDGSAVLLGQVRHSGAVAAGSTYQETVTDALPAVLPGQYFVIVQADGGGLVPDTNRGNSTRASTAAIPVTMPGLTMGTPASGTIGSGQDMYFQLSVPSSGDVTVIVSSAVAGLAEIFERFGSIPDAANFDVSADISGQAKEPLEFFAARAGSYVVLVQGSAAAGSGTSFTITASPAALSLSGLGATSGSNLGQVTVPLVGTFFQSGLAASLLGSNHVAHPALKVLVSSATEAYATFDLSSLALGSYGVQVSAAGQTSTLPAAFSVVAGTAGAFQAQLSFPDGTSAGSGPVEGVITYSNTGGTDVIAPMLILDSGGESGLRLDSSDAFSTNALLLMASSSSGPAGVLRPGEQGEITFRALPSAATVMTLNLTLSEETAASTDAIDYPALEQQIQPAATTSAQFGPIFQQFENEAGPTYGGLVKLMAQTATEIGVLGSGQGNGSIFSGSDVFARVIRDVESQLNGSITGQLVLNDASNPLPNVALSIATADDSQADAAVTFDDGSFSFPAMPAGTYNLFVTGYLLTTPLQIVVPAGGSLSGIDITVAVGASIAGTVVHSSTEAPLASVAVSAVSDQGVSFDATTAGDGSYQFTGLPAGTYTLTAGGGAFDFQTDDSVTLSDNQSTGAVDFALDDAATLDGSVFTSTAQAVGQATILLVDGDGVTFSATTDASGAYSIGNLHPGTYSITVTADGFAPAQSTATLAAGSTLSAPNIVLATAAQVSVTVTSKTSSAVASAQVQLLQNGADVATGGTDSTGRVTISGLAAGTYQLVVNAGGFLGTTDTFTLTAGQDLVR